MPAKGMKLKKINHKSCCSKPQTKYFSSWKDEEPWCVNCGKVLKHAWVEKKWVPAIKMPKLTKEQTKLLLAFKGSSIGTLQFTDWQPEPGFIWKLEFENLIRKHPHSGMPFSGNVRFYSLTPKGYEVIKFIKI